MAVNYLDKEELLQEFRKSKQRKEAMPGEGPDVWLTKRLVKLYMLIVEGVLRQSNWSSYGSNYSTEFQSQALFEFSRYALSFPDNPPHNLFAYYTNMVNSAFRRAIRREKTQERVAERLSDQYDVLMANDLEEESEYDEDY